MNRSRVRLVLVALGSVGTLAALLGCRPHIAGPVAGWDGRDLALASAWIAAVACSAWITLLALACNLALGRPRLAEVLAQCSPRFLRQLAGLALAGSTVVTAVPATAVTATTSTTRPVAAATDEPVVRAPVRPPVKRRAPAPPRAPAPTRPVAATPHRTHLVRAGDNLWRIAREELVARGRGRPDVGEIARYWRAVIDANRAHLRSGNVNLIYPGEVIALPEPR